MDEISQAASILNRGGIIIFPTDTAWGIGCRLDRLESIDRLFILRRRPATQAMPVLVNGVEMARKYFQPADSRVERLLAEFWPGALTVVYPCRKELVYAPVRGQGENIGLRQPDQQSLLNLISVTGVPLLGPSANFHNTPTPFRRAEIDPEFARLADFIMTGECPDRQVSTVVDCSVHPGRVIRQGKINIPLNLLA